jgi:hypothetical protein
MFRRLDCIALVVLFGLLWTGRVVAVAPEIKDDGKFFSADAVKKANDIIRRIAQSTDVDLFIETLPALSGEQAEKLKNMSPAERNKFFTSVAKDRAAAVAVHGIYILVTREPKHLEISLRHGPREFTRKDLDKLKSMLITDFRAQKYDDGLLKAVKFVQEKLTPP